MDTGLQEKQEAVCQTHGVAAVLLPVLSQALALPHLGEDAPEAAVRAQRGAVALEHLAHVVLELDICVVGVVVREEQRRG